MSSTGIGSERRRGSGNRHQHEARDRCVWENQYPVAIGRPKQPQPEARQPGLEGTFMGLGRVCLFACLFVLCCVVLCCVALRCVVLCCVVLFVSFFVSSFAGLLV